MTLGLHHVTATSSIPPALHHGRRIPAGSDETNKGTLRNFRWVASEIWLIVGGKRRPRRPPTMGLGSTNEGLEKKSTSTPLSTRVRKSSALAAAILPACS